MMELQRASREELLEIIRTLLERVEVLEAEVEQLREENLRLRKGGGSGTPLSIKPSRREKEKGSANAGCRRLYDAGKGRTRYAIIPRSAVRIAAGSCLAAGLIENARPLS